jgi:hypothetical protein
VGGWVVDTTPSNKTNLLSHIVREGERERASQRRTVLLYPVLLYLPRQQRIIIPNSAPISFYLAASQWSNSLRRSDVLSLELVPGNNDAEGPLNYAEVQLKSTRTLEEFLDYHWDWEDMYAFASPAMATNCAKFSGSQNTEYAYL